MEKSKEHSEIKKILTDHSKNRLKISSKLGRILGILSGRDKETRHLGLEYRARKDNFVCEEQQECHFDYIL